MSNYTPEQIQFILAEIEKWRKDGLLTERGAQLLRRRYEILPPVSQAIPPDLNPDSSDAQPEHPISTPPVAPTPQPAPATFPLTAVLLSEASIKIALYLGAFFVIAAALILAALVETLRLPVLIGISVMFAAGALALKKRLPQPSFILWLVFSALLPISGGVLADLLNLSGALLSAYWLIVMSIMSALWGSAPGCMVLASSRWLRLVRWPSRPGILQIFLGQAMTCTCLHWLWPESLDWQASSC